MKNTWIEHPTNLKGNIVHLAPLEKEHFEELYLAASDKKLWEFVPLDCSVLETFNQAYSFALTEREKGNQYPFVIIENSSNKIIGSTRLFDLFPDDKKLEIGWTWIESQFWGTKVNFECKLLLLKFCFEELKVRRVQIKTDERNIRSQKAIKKIGAQFEGILRKDKIKENGDSRNGMYFSVIDDEWVTVKEGLMNLLNKL